MPSDGDRELLPVIQPTSTPMGHAYATERPSLVRVSACTLAVTTPVTFPSALQRTHSSAAELRAVQCALDYAQDDLWRGTGNPSCGPQRTHAADSANARWVIVTDCEYVVEYLTRICHTLESKGLDKEHSKQ